MESENGEPLPDGEEVQSEFFFDKTEYHRIMAEALADAPSRAANDGIENPLAFTPPVDTREVHRRQTFFVGAAIVAILLLAAGGVLFFFS